MYVVLEIPLAGRTTCIQLISLAGPVVLQRMANKTPERQ